MNEEDKDILRGQLRLLANASNDYSFDMLTNLTHAMCEIARVLNESDAKTFMRKLENALSSGHEAGKEVRQ